MAGVSIVGQGFGWLWVWPGKHWNGSVSTCDDIAYISGISQECFLRNGFYKQHVQSSMPFLPGHKELVQPLMNRGGA